MMFNLPYKRRSNVLQQPTLDKENIPPQIAIASTIQKPTRMRRGLDAYLRGKWTHQQLEEAMDVMEGGLTSMKKASKHWNIPLSSLSHHLNGKIRKKKVGTIGILIEEEDVAIIVWVLGMQSCGLSITLFQLKLKVVKLIQTCPTPKWCTWKFLVALVLKKTSKVDHFSCKGLGDL